MSWVNVSVSFYMCVCDIKACKGKQVNESLKMSDDLEGTPDSVLMLPESADYLFAYSTAEGY